MIERLKTQKSTHLDMIQDQRVRSVNPPNKNIFRAPE
jgi:hypothetical protein